MKKLLVISTVLFLTCLPLSLKINFYQNDDWLYYQTVEQFKNGNFVLDAVMALTFYVQGLIGVVFSALLPLSRLPLLTLFVATSNFFIFALILNKFFKKTVFQSAILALFLFLSPIFVYSLWGFMTEQYSLLFLLLTLYFFKKHETENKDTDFALMALFIVAGFFVRQTGLVFPLALTLYYLTKKRFKLSILSLATFVTLWVFYNHAFPLTKEMVDKSLKFQKLFDFKYVYALVYGTFVVMAAFLLPLFASFVNLKTILRSKFKVVGFLGLSLGLYLLLNNRFEPNRISWGEFPYFENTFERTGFFPRGLHGTKYQFKGIYDLYLYWDLAAKVCLAIFISYWLLYVKDKINFPLIFIVCYLGLLSTTDVFFDRYLIMAIPFFTLLLARNNRRFSLLLPFLAFLAFFNYQMSGDFVLANDYVWHRAERLAAEKNIPKWRIQGTNAWKENYTNVVGGYFYDFSYDSQEVNEIYRDYYEKEGEYEIRFPGSIFIEPKIFLYKKVKEIPTYTDKLPNSQPL